MFGRVRQSSSSPHRPPSKIFKGDPLSIYEATLIKLKLGSQRDLTSPSEAEQAVDMESDFPPVSKELVSMLRTSTKNDEEAMTIDTDTDSVSASQSTIGDSTQQRSRNASLLYLFSKYNTSRQSDGESMTAEIYGSATSSPSSSNSQSFGGTKEHACITSSSAFTIIM